MINPSYTGPKVNIAHYPNNNILLDIDYFDYIKTNNNFYEQTNDVTSHKIININSDFSFIR